MKWDDMREVNAVSSTAALIDLYAREYVIGRQTDQTKETTVHQARKKNSEKEKNDFSQYKEEFEGHDEKRKVRATVSPSSRTEQRMLTWIETHNTDFMHERVEK